MPQRLPLVCSSTALALLASTLSGHADVIPARRPPAVPPLPMTQAQPSTAQPAPGTPNAKGGAGLVPVSTLTLPPVSEDVAAAKRDAQAPDLADVSFAALTRPVDLTPSAAIKIALADPVPELVKPLEQIALNEPKPPTFPVKFIFNTIVAAAGSDQPAADLANFLPDVELKDISQDADIGFHASAAPLAVEESASVEAATLSLPNIAASYNPGVSLYYNEPVSLYVGGVSDEAEAAEALPPTKPRPRPHDLLASNEPGPSAPEQAPAEPSFQLRR